MASYSATVPCPSPADEVFAYLADFRTVAEWDPSINESIQITPGEPIEVGARFRVTTKTKVSEIVLVYETVELEAPRRIVLRGENQSMVSDDTITIMPQASGCSVTYDARLTLKGVRGLADPLLQLGFQRLGDRSRDGLAAKLSSLPVG